MDTPASDVWKTFFEKLPQIILALSGAIALIYDKWKNNRTIKENTKVVQEVKNKSEDVAKTTQDAIQDMKDSQLITFEAMRNEAKEIADKQASASDEMLRMLQDELKKSDDKINEIIFKDKERD
jgi:hypothetical protein